MAYNVVKGTVEGSVDQHGDQEIEGKKIFKSTISASVFYDTDAQSPCATMKDLAITKMEGSTNGSLMTYHGETTIKGYHNLTYNGTQLRAPAIHGTTLSGDGSRITNVPHDQFAGTIDAHHLNHSHGLHSVRGTLQIKAGNGISATADGVEARLAPMGGLSATDNALCIDPAQARPVNEEGQNLSDKDLLLVSDISRGIVRNTTLSNLYDNYIGFKIPQPAGPKNAIQLKSGRGLGGSAELTYDASQRTLKVEGAITSQVSKIQDALICEGAVIQGIKSITSQDYEVGPSDYTMLCDAYERPITVTLPAACNNRGRVLIIKKTNTDKYNLRSYPVTVTVSEGNIDMGDRVVLKTNYSSRTLQSDGNSWWIIGSKGT
jgi:hypothetical protein